MTSTARQCGRQRASVAPAATLARGHPPQRARVFECCQWQLRLLALVFASCALLGCTTGTQAPIEQKSAAATPPATIANEHARARDGTAPVIPLTHVVGAGETLHAIAYRYDLDYRDLIRWNQISNPDLIRAGQTLRLRAPVASVAARSAATPLPMPALAPPSAATLPDAGTPRGVPKPPVNAELPTNPAVPARAAVVRSTTDLSADPSTPPAAVDNNANGTSTIRWLWPTSGKVTAADSGAGTTGIDIRGTRAQPVTAAAAGTVVYSGSGLRGLGELIIIKHSDTLLSAYAHNEARLVQEGSHVNAGDTIARMGNTDSTDYMLHFEIRRNGKPVDPLQFLPAR